MAIDKTSLSEQDICARFITPAIVAAGWDLTSQIRFEHSFTAGQVIVKGKSIGRGKGKRADYVLSYRENLPLAVVEAKDNNHLLGDGMQQALLYADGDALDVPFVFSSNGDRFLFHDKTQTGGKLETEIALDAFPSPDDLWERYCNWKGLAPKSARWSRMNSIPTAATRPPGITN